MFSAMYSSRSSAASSPHSASASAWRSSKASEMYLRKTRPRTTCLYSAASMLPRKASAIRQYSGSWPLKALSPPDAFSSLEFLRLRRVVVIEPCSRAYSRNATCPPHVWDSCPQVRTHAAPRTPERHHTRPRSLRTRQPYHDPAGRMPQSSSLSRTHTNIRPSAAGVWLEPFSVASSKLLLHSLEHYSRICS